MSKNRAMIRRRMLLALVVAFSLLPPAAVAADRSQLFGAFYCPAEEIPFIGELMAPVIVVLENPKVKAELELTDDQIAAMREVEKDFDVGIREVLVGAKGEMDNWAAAGGKIEDHIINIGKISEDSRKKTHSVLKKKQLPRMQEIMLQLYGVLFIPKKDLRQMLQLDRTQERQIDEIKARVLKKIDEVTPPDMVAVAANKCKFATPAKPDLAAMLEESQKAILQLLSAEQRNIIERLKGKPFVP